MKIVLRWAVGLMLACLLALPIGPLSWDPFLPLASAIVGVAYGLFSPSLALVSGLSIAVFEGVLQGALGYTVALFLATFFLMGLVREVVVPSSRRRRFVWMLLAAMLAEAIAAWLNDAWLASWHGAATLSIRSAINVLMALGVWRLFDPERDAIRAREAEATL